jgi:Ca2+-binding EF-hand superfamily protein
MSSGAAAQTGVLLRAKNKSEKQKKLMKELFMLADENKDGKVDYMEYANLFRSKGLNIRDEEIKYLFTQADKNSDQ